MKADAARTLLDDRKSRKIVGYEMRTAEHMKESTLKILDHFEKKELKSKCLDDTVL